MTHYDPYLEPAEEEIPDSESYVPPDLVITEADHEDAESFSGIEDEEVAEPAETEEEELYRLEDEKEAAEQADELARARAEEQMRKVSGKPDEADFEDYDSYVEALADWKLREHMAQIGAQPGATAEELQMYLQSLSPADRELFDKRQSVLATIDECRLGAEIASDLGRPGEAADWLNRLPLWAKDLEDLPPLEAEKFAEKTHEANISNAIVSLATSGANSPVEQRGLRELIAHHNQSGDPALPLLCQDPKTGQLLLLKLHPGEAPRDALRTVNSFNYDGNENERILSHATRSSWTLSTLADYMNRLKFDTHEEYRAQRQQEELDKAERGKKPRTKNPAKMSNAEYRAQRLKGKKEGIVPRGVLKLGNQFFVE